MIAAVLLFAVGIASAQVVGDLNSSNNDLSWMISVSRPWDGTNANLDGRPTDVLPCDVKDATVQFRRGTYSAGWYKGTLRTGDFVFYVLESKCVDGEWRRITHAGRCGNPATGRYFHRYPPERVRVETVQAPPVTSTVTNTTTVIETQLVPVPELVVCRQTQIIETPVRVPVYLCPPARYVPGAAVAANVDNGGIRFAGVQASDRVQIGSFWGSRRTYRSSTTCPPTPPPPGGTCPPGEAPPPPPPNDPGVVAPPGDPSGQVPCPPDSDPYAPPAQPDHGTGGQPWEPGPDHPNVADPVIPEGAPGDSTAQ
ncbi:MAG: hypothetical protein BWX80_03975 [Candidatus Hydrogenedentes bacterium ADurb.Bin101]|nr:MAG: hypothetical protein BWX80_03975 [Candidatus Hydrogenedentes bacterium ADurb.Bin101]